MRKYYRFTRRKANFNKVKKLIINPRESAMRKALSISLGVFIGVIPIWGMQIASAIFSAQYLNLNKALAVLGSYINLTPIFPIIIFFSLKIGFALTGNVDASLSLSEISLSTAKTYFWIFLLGSIPIAILSSLVFGTITYSIARLIKK